MSVRLPICVCAAALALCALSVPESGRADIIKLQNGGEVRGELDRRKAASGDGPLEITSLSGTRIRVAREETDLFAFRSTKLEEYETRLRRTPETVTAHWELYLWCHEQRLREQCHEQLEAVVELDPNHEQARKLLDHVRYKGQWMPKEEMMRHEGYVKHKGRYISFQEMAIIEKTQQQRTREREWMDTLKKWRNWLAGNDPAQSQQALASLRNLSDPDAVDALVHTFHDHPQKPARLLMIESLQHIGTPNTIEPLARQALFDVDVEVRYQALAAVPETAFPQASRFFAGYLNHKENAIVNRAGYALQQVGNDEAIGELIKALITTHIATVQVPVQEGISFATGGSGRVEQVPSGVLPPEIELLYRTGSFPNGIQVNDPFGVTGAGVKMKPVQVKRTVRNQDVLTALQKLTGQDFGYNQRSWRLWYGAYKNRGGTLSPAGSSG